MAVLKYSSYTESARSPKITLQADHFKNIIFLFESSKNICFLFYIFTLFLRFPSQEALTFASFLLNARPVGKDRLLIVTRQPL